MHEVYFWSTVKVYLKYTYIHNTSRKYTLSILQVYIKNTDLISQNVLQMYFFCQNNIDLKYTSSSVIQQVEVNLKYAWSILEVYLDMFINMRLFLAILWTFQMLHFDQLFSSNLQSGN